MHKLWPFGCCRGFLQLSASQRSQAIDVLSANLRYICSSAQQLLTDDQQPSVEVLQRHRNGLKMVVHLLHIIAIQAQKDSEAAKGAENAAKPVKAAGVHGRMRSHQSKSSLAWVCMWTPCSAVAAAGKA